MGGAPQQRVTTTHDTAMGWIILFIMMIGLFFLFWKYFEYEVKSSFRWVRWSEMKVVSYFVKDDYAVYWQRSEEHTSELKSQMRISYAFFCLKKKKNTTH